MLTIKNTWKTTSKFKAFSLAFFYLFWVAMCAIVVGIIAVDPWRLESIFLAIWMIFGLIGLIVVPFAYLDYLTIYRFDHCDGIYGITIERRMFGARKYLIAEEDWIGFKFEEDEDGKEGNDLVLEYLEKGRLKSMHLLFWQTKRSKLHIINELQWVQGRQTDALETQHEQG